MLPDEYLPHTPDALERTCAGRFPRSGAYEPSWIFTGQMGPHAVWLSEWLSTGLSLKPSMRILDVGCGNGLSSVFFAREFGVEVWANDLWIGAEHLRARFSSEPEAQRLHPIHGDILTIEFPLGQFDAIISIDSFFYMGADPRLLPRLTSWLRPGGMLGVVMPTLVRELPNGPPGHLTCPQASGGIFWSADPPRYRTPAFWHATWEASPALTVQDVAIMPDGALVWAAWERMLERSGKNRYPSDAEALTTDAGRTIGFVRLLAERCV